ELREHAVTHHLHWVEDELNNTTDYMRNFIRHEIMTTIKTRWPTVTNTLARVAEHCAEAQQLLDEVAIHHLKNVQGSKPDTLSVKGLLQLNISQQKLVLRSWISQAGFQAPSAAKLEQIQNNLLKARGDRNPIVTWGPAEVRRYRDDIYLMPCIISPDNKQ